jgi:chromosome segregation ATPase
MSLNLIELLKLVRTLPIADELESRLGKEIDAQKSSFMSSLRKRGYNLDDPSLSPEKKEKIQRAQLSHTIGLYKELAEGLVVCAKELENQIKANPEADRVAQEKLAALQKQITAISEKMQAYAQALKDNQKLQQQELAKQRELDRRNLELERKKELQKELEKEQEKAKAWDKLLEMIMPAKWHESWKAKTEERLNALAAEIKGPEKGTISISKEPAPMRAPVTETKAEKIFSKLIIGGEPAKSGITHPDVPMTKEAQLRRKQADKEFSEFHPTKKS